MTGIVTYDIVPGSINGHKLYLWAWYKFLPLCNEYPGPRSVLILDNVRFHKNPIFKRVCDFVGIKLIYLPPYSPHLNVIELLFNALKQQLKKYPTFCHKNVYIVAKLIMEKRLKRINWESTIRKIGYAKAVRGL